MADEEYWDRMESETAPRLWLYKAALNGDWDAVRRSLENGSANEKINFISENVIHVIASRGDHCTTFLRELVNDPRLDPNVLLQTDIWDRTPLMLAAVAGNTGAARILVERNPVLLTTLESGGRFPVYAAARYGHRETARYLIAQTKQRPEHDLILNGPNGALLLNTLITAGFYGMALSLLDDFNGLAHMTDTRGNTPLETLARRPFKFHSRNWQPDEQGKALELIRRICQDMCEYAIRPEVNMAASEFLLKPLFEAVKLGIHEIVIEIINTCPYLIWSFDSDRHCHTIFHYAVIYRHEKILNLIWRCGSKRYLLIENIDEDGNNILHLAAKLGATTTSQLSGAALQMQRELQWYKEVEKLVQLSSQEQLNANGKTPSELFTEEHKDLVKESEKWMKTTASACTVVAALIVTMVFAASFNVPGGNDDKGIPILLHKPAFIVFSISNTMALAFSSTSLMMFLGILNSRFSEIDFLHSLPHKLIFGLWTLFLSILCMLIAFGAALHLYLVHLSKLVLIPVILYTCIPAILFVTLQFPRLYEIGYSTYGPSIFRHEVVIDYTNNTSTTKQKHPPAHAPAPAPSRPPRPSGV